MKVFILTPLTEQIKQVDMSEINTLADVTVITEVMPVEQIVELFKGSEERILAIDPDFCNWSLQKELIDAVPNLKAIIIASTSFEWVDYKYAAKKGIPVINTTGFSSAAVAEWGMMMVNNLARKIPLVIKSDWKENYDSHTGIELAGKVAGIIGLGSIGKEFAKRAEGSGMKVQYWSKNSRDKKYKFVELSELFKTSDVIYVSVAKNEETESLITNELLNSMRPTAIFVSAVSGIYNHDLIVKNVVEGKLFGYGFEGKQGEFNNYEGNIWAGPSLAWCTKESFQRNINTLIKNTSLAIKGDYAGRIN